MKSKLTLYAILSTVLILLLASCNGVNGNGNGEALKASGIIAADTVSIAPEIGGRITEINTSEGQNVESGSLLFAVDDELLAAQYAQAEAAVMAAQATVDAAKAQLTSAEIQADIVMQGARLMEIEGRNSSWLVPSLEEVELPNWYFNKSESISALETLVEEAYENLQLRRADLDDALTSASNEDFMAMEERLAEAQLAFELANQTLLTATAAQDNEELLSAAEESYDVKLAELENVQLEYDQLLSSASAQEVLETRARAAIAQLEYDNAQDRLITMLSGDDSLQVQAALAGVEQAKTAVSQAEANLAQAEAALTVLQISMDKTKVYAPISGIVLSQNVELGELVGPGGIVMRVGSLDEVKLTVYVPEDKYGQVSLNEEVIVMVDSFPEKTYTGFVTYISDEAEFTPRNVQTVDGRKSTVYAVEISISNPNHDLKPGMPADVTFLEE